MTVASGVGVYRGMCVDNLDPLKQGRIRVQVPGLLGPSASGWAFPAWAMEELQIVPTDRLPQPGQGVWVIAEGEYLYWFAVFGPQTREVPEVYDPAITWVLPVMPLTVSVTIAGILSSPTGTPNPDPVVDLQAKTGSTWSTIGTKAVALDGAFSFSWTRTTETTFRIHFPGTGPYDELYSDERVPPTPPNTATIAWTAPAAVWNIAENVTGILTTSPSGAAAAGSVIRLMIRDGTTGAWTQEGTGTVAANGTWSIPWTRTRTGAINMQAVFMGTSTAGYAETAVVASAAVSVPVTVALNPLTMAFNTPGTVSGTINTALYGPPPGTVRFQVRAPVTTGTWVEAAAITPLSSGVWSFTYTPNNPDADYRAYYPGSGVYQAGNSATQTKSLALTTTTTITVPTGLIHGSGNTWTGYVKDAQNKNVTAGTVTLYRQRTTGDTSWFPVSTVNVSNGTWSASHTPVVVGTTNWRADFSGSAGMLASTSAVTGGNVGLGTVALSKGGVDHTSLNFSWNAISGATSYQTIYTTDGSVKQDSSATSCSRTGLWNMDTFGYQTRAYAADTAGAIVYGAWSGAISAYTGRPELRNSGSFERYMRPSATNTWRPSDGWGYSGDDVLQGYYTSSSNNAFGTCSYDGGEFQNWVRGNWGQAVLDNLSWDDGAILVYRRSGTGTGGSVSQTWYVSPAWAGQGGQPPLAGGTAMGAHTPNNAASWDRGIPYHWFGHVLLNQDVGQGGCRSFVMYRANSSDYSRYYGIGDAGDAMNIYIRCSWNFVTQSYVAPYWN